jgi:hypothetical protein
VKRESTFVSATDAVTDAADDATNADAGSTIATLFFGWGMKHARNEAITRGWAAGPETHAQISVVPTHLSPANTNNNALRRITVILFRPLYSVANNCNLHIYATGTTGCIGTCLKPPAGHTNCL